MAWFTSKLKQMMRYSLRERLSEADGAEILGKDFGNVNPGGYM